jgi:hypothetical protein
LRRAAGDVEDRVPVAPYARIETAADPQSNLSIEALSFRRVHCDVA